MKKRVVVAGGAGGIGSAIVRRFLAAAALDRFSTPDEIAGVAYAIAALMTCVTGQHIVADCGQSIKGYPLFPSATPEESRPDES